MNNTLKARIKKLNKIEKETGDSIIYIMSRDQRVRDNHALIAAQKHANEVKLPLIVCFVLYSKVENRLKNQFEWMIDGLKQVEKSLNKLNIAFNVYSGKSVINFKKIEKEFNPSAIYFDFSPLRGPRKVKKDFANQSESPCYLVDAHNIVPVWVASDKEEFAARTIRPKIHKNLDTYLVEPDEVKKQDKVLNQKENNWDQLLKNIKAEESKSYKPIVKSGEEEALKVLDNFINKKLINYDELRNDPTEEALSNLSAYYHFGQISTLRVALEIKEYQNRATAQMNSSNERKKLNQSIESYLEEMIVRKELSDNFCYYNKNYDNLKGIKNWAKETLNEHRDDKREHNYTYKELENAETHDKAWNAAQKQMATSGKMHGYMRMYWAKKILEWTNTPETALEFAIKLNNKYELDGYDPNGYVGCMWSIGGVHDRAWFEREIFGKIRYMNYNGLKRKFNVEKYEKFFE